MVALILRSVLTLLVGCRCRAPNAHHTATWYMRSLTSAFSLSHASLSHKKVQTRENVKNEVKPIAVSMLITLTEIWHVQNIS